jgi:hypothetical protein
VRTHHSVSVDGWSPVPRILQSKPARRQAHPPRRKCPSPSCVRTADNYRQYSINTCSLKSAFTFKRLCFTFMWCSVHVLVGKALLCCNNNLLHLLASRDMSSQSAAFV